MLAEADWRGYETLSLEAGSMSFFDPARKFYEKFGFQSCAPFGEYAENPYSMFMSLKLS